MVATRAGHASNALGKAEQKRRQAESRPNLLCRRFAVAKMEKEKKEMSKKNNRINVPEAREAMDKSKMEAASEVAVSAPS